MRSPFHAGDVDAVGVSGILTTTPDRVSAEAASTFGRAAGAGRLTAAGDPLIALGEDEPIETLLAAAACAAAIDSADDRRIRSGRGWGRSAQDASGQSPSGSDGSASPELDETLAGLLAAALRLVLGVALLYGVAAWLGQAQ